MQMFLLLHPIKKLFMGRYILMTSLLFLVFNGRSQDFNASPWRHIDTSIEKKKNLSEISGLVQQLRQKAFAEKKYFDAARCYYYQLLIADQRGEDSFYFRNSVFIDSLLMTQKDKPELQLAMHLLQAKRLSAFTTKSLRFNRQRYERKDLPLNYAAFANEKLDSIAQLHFEQAKALAKNISPEKIDHALWLSSDPLLFLFKPGLFDMAIAEQIYYCKKKYYYSFPPGIAQVKFMLLSPDDFIEEMDSLYASDRSGLKQLKYYKEWLVYQKPVPGTYYFIETLARKFAHEVLNNRNDPGTGRDDYEIYLKRISSSSYNTVKAHGVFQLCLLWNQLANKYFPSQAYAYDYLNDSYARKDYDTTYQYHAVKALRLFEQNKAMLDSFTYLKNILLKMKDQILESDINITMEEYNLPGEPILAELIFKNAGKLYYSIVKRNNGFSFTFRTKRELIGMLRKLPEVVNNSIDLPATDDHNEHEAYLKLDALPAGSYDLLFSHLPLSDSNKEVEHIFFRATAIAAVNSNKSFFILDRKTGFPLAGAKLKGSYERNARDTLALKPLVSKEYTANEQGSVTIDDKEIRTLDIYYKNDTISSSLRLRDEDEPEGVYSKEEYDDLAGFYEDNATVHIFTDRSIYRPGQTVHFKAIFLTKNRNTGEPMVMSKENMKGSLLRNAYEKWLKESEPELYFIDPFDRKTDTIKVKPNEYGSVSGAFKIPKTAATGEWSIETDDIDDEGNGGTFKVEEYKRPSYEISIENPKKELLPGDSFSIEVKVKSFAGAALNNVLINYSLDRSGDLPQFDSLTGKIVTQHVNENLADTFAYTNGEGELTIIVNDSLLKKQSLGNGTQWSVTYNIDAEAVDLTGESYEVSSSVFISSRPVNIKLPFADKYNRDEKTSLLITASDRNAGRVSKNIKIKIYRVVKDEKLYGSRKLVKADHWLYDKQQLQQWFPFIDIFGPEDTGTKKLVFETTINTGKNERFNIDPLLFRAGVYLAEAACEENGRLLGENKKYFSVFDEKENKLPQSTWSFYYLPYNSALPGDTIEYYNGNSEKPFYSIYHVTWYSGKRKTAVSQSFETMKQESGINKWRWKVPKDATDQALITQLYVLNNEVFTHDERIFINGNIQTEPEIIIEQYRKKLSPGSKETFSVSIKTKNENTAAELMTTMYDASLDKLEEHKWEKPRTAGNRYLNHDWDKDINSPVKNFYYFNDEYSRESGFVSPGPASPLWWVDPLDYSYNEGIMGDWNNLPARKRNLVFQHDMNPNVRWAGDNYRGAFDYDNASMFRGNNYSLEGRAAGVTITNTQGLNEVVVAAYASVKASRRALASSSVIYIRGNSSLTSYSQPLIILDGVIFEGDLSKIDRTTITQGIILKGADASAIYGARAANGVLVLSTKGEIVFPALPPEPTLPPRKNFNETAFFFPAIYADKAGYYSFTFTMPESVTEWNWKMMAHTKKAVFASAERKLNTQLPLMVQPNMPRLLYQGDRIVLQSRISNLDSTDANGKAICKIEDAVTGEDITSLFVSKMQNDFLVGKKAIVSSAFELKVPKAQMNPIKIIISVRSQNFADGEEHIIPVLSPNILAKENIAFRFSNNRDTTLQPVSLPAGAELYGAGISILPKPQSALINALPYLANYSFDCAEQTFNKLRACVTVVKIMRRDAAAQQSFKKAKQTIEELPEQKEQLPGEISEQAMPWLNLTNKTAKQQKQLFEILDTNRATEQINKHLDKLYKLQNSDGGLTWFDGE